MSSFLGRRVAQAKYRKIDPRELEWEAAPGGKLDPEAVSGPHEQVSPLPASVYVYMYALPTVAVSTVYVFNPLAAIFLCTYKSSLKKQKINA